MNKNKHVIHFTQQRNVIDIDRMDSKTQWCPCTGRKFGENQYQAVFGGPYGLWCLYLNPTKHFLHGLHRLGPENLHPASEMRHIIACANAGIFKEHIICWSLYSFHQWDMLPSFSALPFAVPACGPWYPRFITPGEVGQDALQNHLQCCFSLALLVTIRLWHQMEVMRTFQQNVFITLNVNNKNTYLTIMDNFLYFIAHLYELWVPGVWHEIGI